MENDEKIVLIYTGDFISVEHIKAELESKGISLLINNSFQQGIEAGFVAGVPSAIDIFVAESDVEKALEIIKAITG
jgi:ArsR family metal-binding transcriptional regulator